MKLKFQFAWHFYEQVPKYKYQLSLLLLFVLYFDRTHKFDDRWCTPRVEWGYFSSISKPTKYICSASVCPSLFSDFAYACLQQVVAVNNKFSNQLIGFLLSFDETVNFSWIVLLKKESIIDFLLPMIFQDSVSADLFLPPVSPPWGGHDRSSPRVRNLLSWQADVGMLEGASLAPLAGLTAMYIL